MADPALLELRNVSVTFRLGGTRRSRGGLVRACDDVSLDIRPGETIGLVGESGSGKSTLARVAVLLQRPNSGEVRFDGRALYGLRGGELRGVRATLAMIFQDPRSSLNPRWRVGRSVLRPLQVHGLGDWPSRSQALTSLLADVDLDADIADRYPHELSGGQAQRICIARALALRPRLVIADEALSGLDVTTQASILKLLIRLREQYGTGFLFISHDLRTVRRLSDRVAVMSHGRIVEFRPTADLFSDPQDEYTRNLLTDVVHKARTGEG